VLARAFLDEPVSQRVYRGLKASQILRNLTLDFAGELGVCMRRGAPLEVLANGAIVAAAVIYPPGTYPTGWLDERLIQISTIFGHTRYDLRAWQAWLQEVGKLHPKTPHYYLEYLGVEPALQGQGLGSHLLAELTRRADAAGVGCYLETATARNLPLYQRFGFEIATQKEIIGLPAWFMWRCQK
jgi:ribosomal protein S18 acetylase RimI-like enzyme